MASEGQSKPDGPVESGPPQLYQVIGAALRDVAQARFMSDLYSRQISYTYESDALLRQFPVPRTEITQVELDFKLAVTEVRPDDQRKQSRNAAIGGLLDKYSSSIMRSAVNSTFTYLRESAGSDEGQRRAAADFEKRFIAADRFESIRGRLLRFFNEEIGFLLKGGKFNTAAALDHLQTEFIAFGKEPDMAQLKDSFGVDWEKLWERILQEPAAGAEATGLRALMEQLANEIDKAWDRYADFSVFVEVGATSLGTLPESRVSSVKVIATVKNYRWNKVDVDQRDLRNVRRLSPE